MKREKTLRSCRESDLVWNFGAAVCSKSKSDKVEDELAFFLLKCLDSMLTFKWRNLALKSV